jgi:hypothetical protein
MTVHEDHQREQYFFDPPTVARLAALLSRYERPCCLCAPTLAEALQRRGRPARLLEVDERFARLPGFLRWDLYRPQPLAERFDVLFCDPPFRKVTLAQLFSALRVLCQGDFATPLLLCHLASRERDVRGALGRFGLAPTGIEPGYVSVRPVEEHRVMLYANFTLEP